MKRTLSILLCSVLMLGGCVKTTSPAGPPAPGYTNSYDQTFADILAPANAFFNRLHDDQIAGTFKPTQAEVNVLNSLQSSLAIANPAYLAYHNGTGSLTTTQNAITRVQFAQNAAQSYPAIVAAGASK
jgi:hypothetical protein